ncbi:MAG: hypothetical protein AAGH71_05040 [Planctomycetota bacterium]
MQQEPGVTVILGVPADADPFTVLGLPIADVQDAEVVDALDRRMEEVAKHPRGESVEGNDARLALHAAAARLLDADTRRALLSRAGIAATPRQAEKAPPRGGLAEQQALRTQAVLVIASQGGWNTQARRRLAMLSHAHGVSTTELADTLTGLMHREPGKAAAARGDQAGSRASAHTGINTVSRQRDTGWILTGAMAVVGVLALASAWVVFQPTPSSPARPLPVDQPSNQSAPTQSEPKVDIAATESSSKAPGPSAVPAATATIQGPPNQVADSAGDTPDWYLAAIGMRDDSQTPTPDAVAFVAAGLAETWLDRTVSQDRLAVGTVVDLLYRMPADQAARTVEAIGAAASSENTVAAAWSAGLLSRIAQENALPTQVDRVVLEAMSRSLGPRVASVKPGFASGAAASLIRKAESGAVFGEPWFQLVDRIASTDESLARGVARSSLDAVMRSPFSAGDDRRRRSMAQLLTRLGLPEDRESAGWVLGWFGDSQIATPTLASLVTSLRTQPRLVKGASDLELSPAASPQERSAVRRQLAEQWLDGVDISWASEECVRLARAHLATPAPTTVPAMIDDAVVSSRLINACRLILWGQETGAEQILGSLRSGIPDGTASRSQGTASITRDAASDWALRYLAARRNIPIRQSLLTELIRSRPQLGTIAAEALVNEAAFGSPIQVRRQAIEALPLFADQPSIKNAVLEALPRLPRVANSERIVGLVVSEPLPPIDRDDWPLRARRALVASLLTDLVGHGDGVALDAAVARLAESYAEQAGGLTGQTGSAEGRLLRAAAARYADYTSQWTRAADVFATGRSLRDHATRRDARLALARSDIGRFAAWQVSATELAADVVAGEVPEQKAAIAEQMKELLEQRQSATDVFEQLIAVERAMLQLWLLRIGAGES